MGRSRVEFPLKQRLQVTLVSYSPTEISVTASYNTKGHAAWFSDDKMIEYKNLIFEAEGIDTLPASASALGGLIEFQKMNGFEDLKNVVILTGSI